MLNIGHRGAMGHEPENTLPSFAKALELGVDWIELDVYAVENELVVIHDHTLDRTTNGQGVLMAQSLEYVRSLDAGGGARIPLLSEVFELVEQRVGINVELKGPNTAVPTLTFLEQQINAGWPLDKLLLSSFDHDKLLAAKAYNPHIPRAALYYGRSIDFDFVCNQIEAIAVNPWRGDVTQEMVDEAHQRGLKVLVYTVNEKEEMKKLVEWGVDGIFTNFPDRLTAVLSNEKEN